MLVSDAIRGNVTVLALGLREDKYDQIENSATRLMARSRLQLLSTPKRVQASPQAGCAGGTAEMYSRLASLTKSANCRRNGRCLETRGGFFLSMKRARMAGTSGRWKRRQSAVAAIVAWPGQDYTLGMADR
jgi:hypothetical protein